MEAEEFAHVGREYAEYEKNQGIVDDLTNLIKNLELVNSSIRVMQGMPGKSEGN